MNQQPEAMILAEAYGTYRLAAYRLGNKHGTERERALERNKRYQARMQKYRTPCQLCSTTRKATTCHKCSLSKKNES